MTAIPQPIEKSHMRPLAGGDFLSRSKPTPDRDFAEAMRPFMSQDLVGTKGHHTAQAGPVPLSPLHPMDFVPGLRTKGEPQPLAPLTPADSVPGVRGHGKDGDVEQQARKWVAQTFFGTLLKQMHDSPFKSDLFSGGRGGKAFEPLMDQHLADHMTRGAGKKLVRGIVAQLKGRAAKAYKQQQTSGKADAYSDLNAAGGAGSGDRPPGSESGEAPAAKPSRGSEANPYQNVRVHVAPGVRG